MCRKIRNHNIYYNDRTGERVIVNVSTDKRPFIHGKWAIEGWEYVIDSRGNYIGCIEDNKFVPLGE